ncbi:MAG TPA: hypothetical protein VGN00_05315 [Puia sp.]|jgi:hypothetical protein
MKELPLLSLIATSLILGSCHKNNDAPGNSGQLAGNYKFLFVSLQAQSTQQESGGGQTEKTITYTNYKTINNSGTVTFTQDSIFSKGVGYTANTTLKAIVYENGTLTDSLTLPFSQTYPPSNSSTKFDVYGQDSVAFHGGYLTTGLSGGTAIAPPSGGRFSFKGDTLFITSTFTQTLPNQTSGGVTVSQAASGVAVIGMLRQ